MSDNDQTSNLESGKEPVQHQDFALENSAEKSRPKNDELDLSALGLENSEIGKMLQREYRLNQGNQVEPPFNFHVPDLRRDFQLSKYQNFSFESSEYRKFSPEFFDASYPLHDDFEPTKIMPLLPFLGVVIAAIAFVSSPLLLMMISLGPYFHWEVVSPFLAMVAIFLIAMAVYLREQANVKVAWQRYATWILKHAEHRDVHAEYTGLNSDGDRVIELTYPNDCHELIYAMEYENENILKQLKHNATVKMYREWEGQSAVVILQLDIHRIWCTNDQSKKLFRF